MKNEHELSYWSGRFCAENSHFQNSHYENLMLLISEQSDDNFMSDKVVCDFGCGPRGSLFWTKQPRLKVGIDVLADIYVDNFYGDIINHEMIYVKSTERFIPLPSNFADILFTINSLDHVDNLSAMFNEISRILKCGGYLYGAFNLNEPSSLCEPQTLTIDIVKHLFCELFDFEYKIAIKDSKSAYKNLFERNFIDETVGENIPCLMFVRAKKIR